MIFEGDCLDVMATMEAGSVDLILTDPPYGLNYSNGDLADSLKEGLVKGRKNPARPILSDSPEEWENLMRGFLSQASRLLKPGACCCCCCGGGGPKPTFARLTLWMDEHLGFKQAVIWDKTVNGLGFGWHYRRSYEFVLVAEKPGAAGKWYGGHSTPNVIQVGRIIPSWQEHPTLKPVELMEFFIRLHSAPGDLVLDPCCGSGTTGVAAQRIGRRFVGIEKDPHWARVARVRTGEANQWDNNRLLGELPLFWKR